MFTSNNKKILPDDLSSKLSVLPSSQIIGTYYWGSHQNPRRNLVINMVGDSNTDGILGRPGWQAAVELEWKSDGGIFQNCTIYNNGANGSTLAGWVNNIVAKEGDARDKTANNTTNPWDVVGDDPPNTGPDIIILSLGTNDFNNPGSRSTIGAAINTNFDTLINFFLEKTKALIWLRMPQPFTWGEGADPFDYLTQWTNDADCEASTVALRAAYTRWVAKHPRVLVYDTHKHLTGYKCDDKTTDCLDPEDNSSRLIDDGLHMTNLGYRRVSQQMAQQWSGDYYNVNRLTLPSALRTSATWVKNIRIRSATASPSLIDVELSNEYLEYGQNMIYNGADNPVSKRSQRRASDAQLYMNASILGELLSLGGLIKIYCHSSGNTYTCTSFGLSQIVTGAPPTYAVLAVNGLSGGPMVSGDLGIASVWVESVNHQPFSGPRRLEDLQIVLPAGQSSITCPHPYTNRIGKIIATRNYASAQLFQLRARNQVDGRWVSSDTYTSGKPIADILFSAGFLSRPTITYRTDLWPSGIVLANDNYLTLDSMGGSALSTVNCLIMWRVNNWPVISSQPSDTSVSAGADASFTVVATGYSSLKWQESTDSGATWADISGATSATYTKTGTVLGDSGNQYRCLLAYSDPEYTYTGSYISSIAATLTVT